MSSEITVVSGLPRCGTSLMMQMLDTGGIPAVTDSIRAADTDNPRGYYEYERVKKIKEDATWLAETRGKAFKMVSQLLYDLPPTEKYSVIFMERDMDEMLVSQEKMLARLNREAAPRDDVKRAFTGHLSRLFDWLGKQSYIKILKVNYNDLVDHPEVQIARVNAFLGGRLDAARMSQSIDPALYRNRKSSAERPTEPA
jgi:hypothetical protein